MERWAELVVQGIEFKQPQATVPKSPKVELECEHLRWEQQKFVNEMALKTQKLQINHDKLQRQQQRKTHVQPGSLVKCAVISFDPVDFAIHNIFEAVGS